MRKVQGVTKFHKCIHGLGKKKDSQIDRKLNQRQKKYWKSYRVSQTMYVQLRQEKRKIDDNVKGLQKKVCSSLFRLRPWNKHLLR